MNLREPSARSAHSHVSARAGLVIVLGMMLAAAQVYALPPLVMQVQSRKVHGLAGALALDVHAIGAVECRVGGPTQLRVTFDRPVQGVGGLSTDDVTLTSGNVAGVAMDGNTLTIDLAGCENGSRLNVAFPGIADADDVNALVRDILCVGVLAGDVNGDGSTSILDLVTIRNGLNVAVGPDNFRIDVTADGAINILDLVNVRNSLNTTIIGTCMGPVAPGMVLIPAGEFLMGNSFDPGEGYPEELPRHAVDLDDFYIDRTEVTNQQYADALNWAWSQGGLIEVVGGVVYQFNNGTSYPYCDTVASEPHSRITWDGSTFGVVAGKENHPMVSVSWYGAVAYCNWRSAMAGRALGYDLTTWTIINADSYRLPTDAEWEKAARGGAAGCRYAWPDSDTIQHVRANYWSFLGYSYDTSPTRGFHPTFSAGPEPYTSPVGYFAPNGYGLYDVVGNAFEWCNDWFSDTYYGSSPYANPLGPGSGTNRVLRGGSWTFDAFGSRVAYRSGGTPDLRDDYPGFRCAAGATAWPGESTPQLHSATGGNGE